MSEPPTIFASINRWLFPLIGLLAVGPLAAWPIAALRAPDGAFDTTPIMSGSPGLGLLAGVAALILAGLWGLITALVTSVRYGLFTTGLALAWAAWSTGTMDLIMRSQDAADRYWRLPIEGVIFGAVAILVAGVIAAVGRKPAETEIGHSDRAPGDGIVDVRILNHIVRSLSSTLALFRRGSDVEVNIGQRLLIVLAAAAVAALAALFISVESLKGQTFAAAAIGALLGATAGEVIASSGRGETVRAPVALFFIAATILAIAAPVAAMAAHSGPAGVAQAATTARLLAFSTPLPLDWLAGAFIGVPIGLTWADALVDRAQKT